MISKKDFEILYWIEFMKYNSPKQLSKVIEVSGGKLISNLKEFEKKGLISIEFREGKVYGSQLTEKGKAIWNNKKYLKWKEELGY